MPSAATLRLNGQAISAAATSDGLEPLHADHSTTTHSRQSVRRRVTSAELIGIAAAALGIATAAGLNAEFAHALGKPLSVGHAYLFVAGSVAATLAAASMPSLALAAFVRWQIIRGMAASLLWAAAIGISVASAIGATSTARSDMTASREHDASAATRTVAEYDRLSAELGRIMPARPAAELVPMIDATRALTRGANCGAWVPGATTRGHCADLAALEAERARSTRMAEIEARLQTLSAVLANSRPAGSHGSIDPQSAAIATALAALGATVKPATVSLWLAIGPAVFFELLASLGLLAAGVGSGAQPSISHGGPTVAAPTPCADPSKRLDGNPAVAQATKLLSADVVANRPIGVSPCLSNVAEPATVVATVAANPLAEPAKLPVAPATVVGVADTTVATVVSDPIQPPILPAPEAVVREFVSERILKVRGASVRAGELHVAYTAWALSQGHHPASLTTFGRCVQEIGLKRQSSGGRVYYVGVELAA